MNRKRRILALVLAAFVAFSILCSYNFITSHIHHHCEGEDCPVCATMEVAAQIVSQYKSALLPVLILSFLCPVFVAIVTKIVMNHPVHTTLITNKVELLN